MYNVKVDKNHMISVLCGVRVDLPWRSQPGVAFSLPYEEWLSFMSEYGYLFKNRSELIAFFGDSEYVESEAIKSYLIMVASSLYNEIMISADKGEDATLIYPVGGGCHVYSQSDFNNLLDTIDVDEIVYAQSIFASMSPQTFDFNYAYLSSYNLTLLKISIILLRCALNDEPCLISFDWRYTDVT